MEQRAFKLTIAALVGLTLVSASPMGAMIGFMLGIAVAFFAVPVLWMVASALGSDLETIMVPALITVALIGIVFSAVMIARLAAASRAGDAAAVRQYLAVLTAIVLIPASMWLSSQALVDAWP
jgi:heme/copper-type cytochrome/quinol oxidase subunit 4